MVKGTGLGRSGEGGLRAIGERDRRQQWRCAIDADCKIAGQLYDNKGPL